MLVNKIFGGVLSLNASQWSNRSFLNLAEACSVLSNKPDNTTIRFLSSPTIGNYERNHNDQNRNSHKVSRTLVSFKYLRHIKNSIRESGPILKANLKLMHLIENAQKNRLSPDFINFAVRISCDIRAKVGLFDLFLSNGCHFLIQYEDIDSATTKHHLLELCGQYDGSLIQGETFWPKSFEQKGMIFIRCSDSDPFADISKEQLISKVGIESCHKETDAEGVEYRKLYCDPWLLHDVKKQCQEITNGIEEVCVGYIPKKIIVPSPHTRSSIYNILFKLCEVPTIDNIYCNINLAQYMS